MSRLTLLCTCIFENDDALTCSDDIIAYWYFSIWLCVVPLDVRHLLYDEWRFHLILCVVLLLLYFMICEDDGNTILTPHLSWVVWWSRCMKPLLLRPSQRVSWERLCGCTRVPRLGNLVVFLHVCQFGVGIEGRQGLGASMEASTYGPYSFYVINAEEIAPTYWQSVIFDSCHPEAPISRLDRMWSHLWSIPWSNLEIGASGWLLERASLVQRLDVTRFLLLQWSRFLPTPRRRRRWRRRTTMSSSQRTRTTLRHSLCLG